MAVYRELGGEDDVSELATAVEVVHTYSLVHDDLPCMDDDELRRGRPTTHRQFDIAAATEAGFRLVPLSLRVLQSGASALGLAAEKVTDIARELFRAAGATGMIKGQVLDLEAEGRAVSREELVAIHECKTGALITASAVMGALAAGADRAQVEAVRKYGEEVGLAFQVVDDILDATATSSELGKTAGKDAEQRKATFATIVGLEAARHAADDHAARAMDHLASAGLDSGLLGALARYIVERGN
jgi:geranylgeranyl pyrophosphate synthase